MLQYVFIKQDEKSVMVFSEKRIPFEIKKCAENEELLKFKAELRRSIKGLEAKDGYLLFGRYGTIEEKNGFYDLENVLFYNLGESTFSAFAQSGVAFSKIERFEIKRLQKQWKVPCTYVHCYEYTVTKIGKRLPFYNLLAKWTNLPFDATGITPLKIRNALCKLGGDVCIAEQSFDVVKPRPFALCLEIEMPFAERFYVTTAMKPLLDGAICAFHGWDSKKKEEIAFCAEKIGTDEEGLLNARQNLLGEREYVQEYKRSKTGIKWNPADDQCVFARITVKKGEAWRWSGQLYRVPRPCPRCGRKKIAKIIYGMPDLAEVEEDLRAGQCVLAGCMVEEDKPKDFRCRWCKHEFV